MDHSIRSSDFRHLLFAVGFGLAGVLNMAPLRAQEMCGGTTYPFPYTDVSGVGAAFCPGIMEAYVTGISKGTSPTTFSPNNDVPRLQMTTFLQRTVDQVLARGSRRAALNQWSVPNSLAQMQTVPAGGTACAADGQNIWADNNFFGQVSQIQPGTGIILNTWTDATSAQNMVVAAGKIFIAGTTSPGSVYSIDPTLPPGPVTTASVSPNIADFPESIAFDGTNLWTANKFSVSIISLPPCGGPCFVSNVTTGFTELLGIVYDGAHIWVTDVVAGKLFKLDSSGNIIQTVTVGAYPSFPAFDGANIWVPNQIDNSITVVQASTGNVVATINSDATNNLNAPFAASFDGERILITNISGNSLTVFKAADLSFIANVSISSSAPYLVCSDGVNFWVNLANFNDMVRF